MRSLAVFLCFFGVSCTQAPPEPSSRLSRRDAIQGQWIGGHVLVERDLAAAQFAVTVTLTLSDQRAMEDAVPFTRPCFYVLFARRCGTDGPPWHEIPEPIPAPGLHNITYCPAANLTFSWQPTFTDWRRVPASDHPLYSDLEPLCAGEVQYRVELQPAELTVPPVIQDSYPRSVIPLTE